MKICIINNLYPPYVRGGAEQVVAKTVQGLLERGHRVVIITSSPAGGSYCEMETKLTTYRFRPKNLFFYTDAHHHNWFSRLWWHLLDIFHLPAALKIKKILEKEKPDIVHTHNFMGLGFLTPWIIRKIGIKHFHTVHDVQLVEPSGIVLKAKENSFRYQGPHVYLYSLLLRILMGSPNVVISPSQFLLDFYEKRGFFKKSKKVMLRNPVTFERGAENDGQKTRYHKAKQQEINRQQFNFLYLGQVEYHKGAVFLIESFKKFLEENNKKVCLSVAGDGSKFTLIKDMAKDVDQIKILGRVTRDDLPNLFKITDITIVPSLCYENSPTVIFESFAFGVPVLASDIEGIAELIQVGENGFTFKAGDGDSLVKQIKWCLDNHEKISQMSAKTSKFLVGLGQKEYVEKLEGLYSEILF